MPIRPGPSSSWPPICDWVRPEPFRIGLNEVRIGMTVPSFAIEIARQRLLPAYFDRTVVSGAMFGPDEAMTAGFLDRVVAPDDLGAESRAAAADLADLDPGAHAGDQTAGPGRFPRRPCDRPSRGSSPPERLRLPGRDVVPAARGSPPRPRSPGRPPKAPKERTGANRNKGMSWSEPQPQAGFPGRLRARLLDPINAVIPPLIAVFCLARPSGLIAAIPYWEIVALVLTTFLVNSVGGAMWADATTGRRLVARVGVEMGTIALVIYGIGWGPILVVGFVYGAADAMRTAGSAAARPAMVWTVVFVALGQLAIVTGLAPTLVHQPQVHGLGALAALGAVLTIKLLEWFAVGRESSEGRFRALVQHASDIIVVTDADGRLSYVSPAFARILRHLVRSIRESSGERTAPSRRPGQDEGHGRRSERWLAHGDAVAATPTANGTGSRPPSPTISTTPRFAASWPTSTTSPSARPRRTR